jgi:cholesterol transport system auxiliary component
VRFTLRATILDSATRQVIAAREFDAVAAAPSEDPYGGVVAANQAVRDVLASLAEFCANAARNWRPRSKPAA